MVMCYVLGCKSRSERKEERITFHKFPAESDVLIKWIASTGRLNWQPTDHSRICSKHFTKSCFRETKRYKCLKPRSIPTLFMHITHEMSVDQPSTSHCTPMEIDIDDENTCSNESIIESKYEPNVVALEIEVDNLTKAEGDEVFFAPETHALTPKKLKLTEQLQVKTEMEESREKKIAVSTSKAWLLNKNTAEQSVIIEQLREKSLINEETADLLSSIDPENREFLKRFLCKGKEKKYSPSLRKFALTLHFISSRAYRFVRQKFDTCLPHPRTLSRWYQTMDGNPGFSIESLKAVRQLKEIETAKNPQKKILCALCFDEMAIKKRLDFDGTDCIGFVDHGNNVETEQLAKEALVFMLTCINGSWKIPLGYFLLDGISADQKATLLKTCITLVQAECGVDIISVTFDGCLSNLAMAKLLGCSLESNNINPSFCVGDQKIVIFPDPAHMLKLIRNTMAEKENFTDGKGRTISWQFIKSLFELQENEGLHMVTKGKTGNVNFKRHIINVKLAAQLLSQSVADAIQFCADELKIDDFQHSEATVEFITNFNKLFDVMNSRNLYAYGFKKPISEKNFVEIKEFLTYMHNYISGLQLDGKNILSSGRKTGFLGFLICIKSLLSIYEDHVLTRNLFFVGTYKMSQDHVEYLFSSIRSRYGFNNNPTARQFRSAFKELLVCGELRHITMGTYIPLQDIDILMCTKPELAINKTSERDRMIEIENCIPVDQLSSELQIMDDHDYLTDPTRLLEYSKRIIEYIAGFIVGKLKKEINCEGCVSLLISSEKYKSSQLKKDEGGLNYPTKDVVHICEICEKIFRQNKGLNKKNFPMILTHECLKQCLGLTLFANSSHFKNQSCLDNHFPCLIKAICLKYFKIRIYHATKSKRLSKKKTKKVGISTISWFYLRASSC